MPPLPEQTWGEEQAENYLKAATGRIPFPIWAAYQGPNVLRIIQFLSKTTFYHGQAAQGRLYDGVMRTKNVMPDPWGFLAYCIHASLREGHLTPKFIEKIREQHWTFDLFSVWDPEMETYSPNEVSVHHFPDWVSSLFGLFLDENSSDMDFRLLSPPQAVFRDLVVKNLRVVQANKNGVIWEIPGIDMKRDPEVIRQQFEGDRPRAPTLFPTRPPPRKHAPSRRLVTSQHQLLQAQNPLHLQASQQGQQLPQPPPPFQSREVTPGHETPQGHQPSSSQGQQFLQPPQTSQSHETPQGQQLSEPPPPFQSREVTPGHEAPRGHQPSSSQAQQLLRPSQTSQSRGVAQDHQPSCSQTSQSHEAPQIHQHSGSQASLQNQ